MARKNQRIGYDIQRVWSINVAPLLSAAREGARQAARTVNRERTQARRRTSWQRRWLMLAMAGLTVAGTAGGTIAVLARRRAAQHHQYLPDSTRRPAAAGSQPGAARSTMEAGRDRVADTARTVMHKARRAGVDDTRPMTAPAGADNPPSGASGAEPRSGATIAGGHSHPR